MSATVPLVTCSETSQHLAEVRLVILDFDGVLTDGRRHYHEDGHVSAAFDVRDGLGVHLLIRAGISVAIVSNGGGQILEHRAHDIGVHHLRQNVHDKGEAADALATEVGHPLKYALYLGDDVWDIPAFRKCGYAVATADAMPEVLAEVDAQTSRPGGAGAVRETADAILLAQDRVWRELLDLR